MNKSILLIYAINKNTGLSRKVRKIHDGFFAAGCGLEKIYVDVETGFFEKIVNIFIACLRLLKCMFFKRLDIIYIRYLYYFLPIYLILIVIRKPYQIEINNNITASFSNSNQVFRAWLDSKLSGFVINKAQCVHVVTNELVGLYRSIYPNANIMYTPNFVVDEHYRSGERSKADVDKFNMVFMGDTEQEWHGMPLFIETVIVNNPWFVANCRLHILGRCSPKIDGLIANHGLSSSIVTHGFLSGKDKYAIIDDMDIGIGCFNLPLIGLKEATAIKMGEYLYSGLSLIMGAPDSRLPSALPFVLYVDLINEPSSAAESIKKFVTEFQSRQIQRAEAHDYAGRYLMVDKYIQNILLQ